jgi:hypothetical protein
MKLPNQPGESEPSDECLLELRPRGNRIGLFSRVDISAGTVILRLSGPLRSRPTQYSIQLGDDLHLDAGGNVDDELNHSCDASARMDLEAMSLIAKRKILRDEEITINYCATEEALDHPFKCDCGCQGCYGFVRGFRFLTQDQRKKIQDELSRYLKKKRFASADRTQDSPATGPKK